MKIYVKATTNNQYPDDVDSWARFLSKRVSPADYPDMYTKYYKDYLNTDKAASKELLSMMEVENFSKDEISAFSSFLDKLFSKDDDVDSLELDAMFNHFWEISYENPNDAFHALESAYDNFETPEGLSWNELIQKWDNWLASKKETEI